MAFQVTELGVEHEDTSSRARTPDLGVTPFPHREEGARVRQERAARVRGAPSARSALEAEAVGRVVLGAPEKQPRSVGPLPPTFRLPSHYSPAWGSCRGLPG